MAKRAKKQYEYKVHPLDVWGNEKDGFEVNDVYPASRNTTTITGDTDHDVITALKKDGYIKPGVRFKSISVEGEMGYHLYVGDARNGEPVYELRPVDLREKID